MLLHEFQVWVYQLFYHLEATQFLKKSPHIIGRDTVIVEREPQRLFVCTIPENFTNNDLARYFNTFGEVLSAEKVIKAGLAQTHGFVHFIDEDNDLVKKLINIDVKIDAQSFTEQSRAALPL